MNRFTPKERQSKQSDHCLPVVEAESVGPIKILAIDDQVVILHILEEILGNYGFDVEVCENGARGIELYESFLPDMVLCDLRMPVMDGFEVISALREKDPYLPIIIVSAQNDIKDVTKAIRLGAWDYITKPIYDFDLLIHTINNALDKSRLNRENEEYKTSLEKKVEERTEELAKLNQQLQDVVFATVSSFAILTEKRDPYTAGHQERVSQLAALFARTLGYDEERINGMRVAAQLHDIGKIYVPSEFLTKPSRLEKMEFEIIKRHASVGFDILQSIPFPWPVADMVHQHHERLDGSGYPLGLKNGDILPESQLIAIADSFEAMVAHRPYRPGLGVDFALNVLKKEREDKYCAEGVDVLVHLVESNNEELFQNITKQ